MAFNPATNQPYVINKADGAISVVNMSTQEPVTP
jgi:DNA-binding beta-propeller fold protein YncE